MKSLIYLFSFLFMCMFSLNAATVNVEWDPNAATDNITNYEIWDTLPDKTVKKLITVAGNVTTAKLDLTAGVHVIYAVAVSNNVSSDPSNTLTITVPNKPGTPRVKVTIQTSTTLDEWKDLVSFEEEATGKKFYRVKLDM